MISKLSLWIGLGLAAGLGLGGCASPVAPRSIEARPLGAEFAAYEAPRIEEGDGVAVAAAAAGAAQPTGILTLRDALGLALLHRPELAVYSWDVRRREARMLQSGLAPNPELDVEFENFGGGGAFDGDDSLESTVMLSQLVELGGKRVKRMEVASLERDLANWDYEIKRLEVFGDVAQAFATLLAAQERLALNGEFVKLAEQVATTVGARVGAGRVPRVEETRVKVALSLSRIEHRKSIRTLDAARRELAATWGGGTPVFTRAEGNFEKVGPIPSYENLENRIAQNPALARWAAEMDQRRARLNLEQANRIPDVTIRGGLRRFNETNDNAFVLGFSIPLPVFDRNQGAILEAEYALAKAAEEQRAARLGVHRSLNETYRALASAHGEVTALRDEVLPGAQSAFDDINVGYREGKFGYLEVLDTQRTLFDARGRYFDALAEYHGALAAVESLIGERLISDEPREEQTP